MQGDQKGLAHETVIRNINTVNASFVLSGLDVGFGVEDLGQMIIIRCGESQNDIRRHLQIGKKALLSGNALAGGPQFCADIVHICPYQQLFKPISCITPSKVDSTITKSM